MEITKTRSEALPIPSISFFVYLLHFRISLIFLNNFVVRITCNFLYSNY